MVFMYIVLSNQETELCLIQIGWTSLSNKLREETRGDNQVKLRDFNNLSHVYFCDLSLNTCNRVVVKGCGYPQ